jgi:hypothetical protein
MWPCAAAFELPDEAFTQAANFGSISRTICTRRTTSDCSNTPSTPLRSKSVKGASCGSFGSITPRAARGRASSAPARSPHRRTKSGRSFFAASALLSAAVGCRPELVVRQQWLALVVQRPAVGAHVLEPDLIGAADAGTPRSAADVRLPAGARGPGDALLDIVDRAPPSPVVRSFRGLWLSLLAKALVVRYHC